MHDAPFAYSLILLLGHSFLLHIHYYPCCGPRESTSLAMFQRRSVPEQWIYSSAAIKTSHQSRQDQHYHWHHHQRRQLQRAARLKSISIICARNLRESATAAAKNFQYHQGAWIFTYCALPGSYTNYQPAIWSGGRNGETQKRRPKVVSNLFAD